MSIIIYGESYPEISRHYYLPPPTTGTREALMELREAPYPYSKMCELCELCELLERKIPPLSRWDFLIYPQQNLFVFSGTPEISDFWGEAPGDPKELCSNGES